MNIKFKWLNIKVKWQQLKTLTINLIQKLYNKKNTFISIPKYLPMD